MSDVIAKGKLHGHDIEARAINPGDWWGKVWLIEIGCGFSLIFFAVEADHVTDAIDEFLDWERENETTYARIDEDDDSIADDYLTPVSLGDMVGGINVEAKGYLNLRGVFYPEGSEPSCHSEPYVSGEGVYADLDHLMVHGQEGSKMPWVCRYHHPAFKHTPEGIDPRDWDAIDSSRID